MLFFELWHVGGLMLLGMALLKSDVLAGRKTRRQYARLAAIGLACGLPLVAWGLYQFQAVDWRLPDSLFIIPLWNYWGSVLVALGYIGLLLMIWKAGVIRGIVLRLASVGRTAFSCYILETLICTTIFYGHGLGLFGTVDRLQQLLLTVVHMDRVAHPGTPVASALPLRSARVAVANAHVRAQSSDAARMNRRVHLDGVEARRNPPHRELWAGSCRGSGKRGRPGA